MHSFKETRILPYNADFIYEILMDVEKYPEFLPWCNSVIIQSEAEDHIQVEVEIIFKTLVESYISKVYSKKTDTDYEIKSIAIAGKFKHMESIWRIKSVNNGSEVNFSIDFEFKSKILDMLASMVFSSVVEKMVSAFESRAREMFSK